MAKILFGCVPAYGVINPSFPLVKALVEAGVLQKSSRCYRILDEERLRALCADFGSLSAPQDGRN